MGKHLGLKAFVLLVVIFFHSFVLVPKANATAFQGVIGRIAFRAIAPSVIAGLGSGMAAVIGVSLGVGIGYVIIKSGGITALKNWLNSAGSPLAKGANYRGMASNGLYYSIVTISGPAYQVWTAFGGYHLSPEAYGDAYQGVGNLAYAVDMINGALGQSGSTFDPPIIPTDYITSLATTQPAFDSTTHVFATPGAAAALVGGAAIVTATTMPDSDADKFKTGSGATAVTNSGTQATNPAKTDNTVTQGDVTNQGMFQQMINYLSNLVGIQTSIDASKSSIDNMALGMNIQTGILDNVGSGINRMTNTMDNVGIGVNRIANSMDNVVPAIQNQTAILDNVGGLVRNLDNTVSSLKTTTATQSSLMSRVAEVRDLLVTKFPFSFALAVADPGDIAGETYSIPNIQMPLGQEIVVDPLRYPALASFISFVRGIVALGMWAIFVLYCIRKGAEL